MIAWQRARELTRRIYQTTGRGNFAKDYALREQIRRAAISVMSNLAEGFDRGGRREFRQFIVVAKGSNAEVRWQLQIARDVGYLDENEFNQLRDLSAETGRIISGLLSAVSKQIEKGDIT